MPRVPKKSATAAVGNRILEVRHFTRVRVR
jgi:hypothetical protein